MSDFAPSQHRTASSVVQRVDLQTRTVLYLYLHCLITCGYDVLCVQQVCAAAVGNCWKESYDKNEDMRREDQIHRGMVQSCQYSVDFLTFLSCVLCDFLYVSWLPLFTNWQYFLDEIEIGNQDYLGGTDRPHPIPAGCRQWPLTVFRSTNCRGLVKLAFLFAAVHLLSWK